VPGHAVSPRYALTFAGLATSFRDELGWMLKGELAFASSASPESNYRCAARGLAYVAEGPNWDKRASKTSPSGVLHVLRDGYRDGIACRNATSCDRGIDLVSERLDESSA
jgi:hypothetical protein